jgi:DNA-directed RNA polymerase subunit K/omega
MEKERTTVKYDKQVFDDLGVNPYEVVIAVSRMARDINDKAQKYLSHDCDVHPISVAMKRIQSRQVHFKYDEEI